MNKKLSPRDQEAISAYSDGQLRPKEQARIEERLRTDPGLREAFADLERTRQVIRALPKMKAPRSFLLSPDSEPVVKPTISGLFPSFRLVSVLATILFVVVAIGDFYNFSYIGFSIRKDQSASQISKEGEAGFAPQMEVAEAPAFEPMEMPSDEIEVEKSITEISTPRPAVDEQDAAGTPISPEGEESFEVMAELVEAPYQERLVSLLNLLPLFFRNQKYLR